MLDLTQEEIDANYWRLRNTKLLTFAETADAFGCSHRTLRKWQSQGKMPHRIRQGHALLYREADVVELRKTLKARRYVRRSNPAAQ